MTPDVHSPALPANLRRKRRLGRADRSMAGLWFWEIDRLQLLLVAILVAIGLVAVAAASPSAAHRYSNEAAGQLSSMHYFYRQLVWVAIAIPVCLFTSMLSKTEARRFGLIGAAVFTVMLMAVPLVGVNINGARRWLEIGMQFQPSEFLKPFFAVAIAFVLSLKLHDKTLPVGAITFGMTALVAAFLLMQPDLGQTIIYCSIWGVLMILSGASKKHMLLLAILGPVLVIGAYFTFDHVANRIDGFLFGAGDTFQVERAKATITAGGWLGVGPGAGEAKFGLPEAHTDYIFSVIGEEFGLIACIAIAMLYFSFVARAIFRLLDEKDLFVLLAAAGITTQFGMQALINMAVNVNLAPSKGMTLPFISYGGSSMIALGIGFGLLLAFTRRNPFLARPSETEMWSDQ